MFLHCNLQQRRAIFENYLWHTFCILISVPVHASYRVCFRSPGRFQHVDMCPSMDPVPFPRETREESSKGGEGWGQAARLEEAAGCEEGSRGVERLGNTYTAAAAPTPTLSAR